MTQTGEKLTDLGNTLMGVENELLKRKVDRQEKTIDGALDVINKAAEAGVIDLTDQGATGGDVDPDGSETQGDDAVTADPGGNDTDTDTDEEPESDGEPDAGDGEDGGDEE